MLVVCVCLSQMDAPHNKKKGINVFCAALKQCTQNTALSTTYTVFFKYEVQNG